MKMTVFWDVAPYCLVEVYRHFRGNNCLHHHYSDDEGRKHFSPSKRLLKGYSSLRTEIRSPSNRFHRPDDGGSKHL
jgi:hypothetical protein